MNFLVKAQEIKGELIGLRRDFHRNPELGFELTRTSQKVKEFLEREGIEYRIVAETGIVAIIRGEMFSSNTKTIAIRGDMDALPLLDKKNTLYSSKSIGKMHACGHDAHTTMILGAAKILNAAKSQLKGNVKLFFEPAEETVGGARLMIEQGVLEEPTVDAIIGCHVDEGLPVGTIGIKPGVAYAASNPFTIKIYGKGAHGASPHKAIDPIVIGSNVIMALQTLVSREVNPTSPAVITIGTFNGGTAQNIIPEEVSISGIIRTMKLEDREYFKNRLREIVQGIVTTFRGSCEIQIDESYPCLYNDDEMYKFFEKVAISTLGQEKVTLVKEPTMGVESFAYFSLKKPSMFYWLGCGNKEKGIVHPAHSSMFDIDEDCIPIGVALHCATAFDFLNKD
ncbi:M20 family metallopeptidase [Clostridium sp.]|uniref:M20 metallopeptidase family protein n=1 Tax=Clostridium sp. TaxID=1506 RepID=UPI002FC6FA0E